jgi:hypothetical protein
MVLSSVVGRRLFSLESVSASTLPAASKKAIKWKPEITREACLLDFLLLHVQNWSNYKVNF